MGRDSERPGPGERVGGVSEERRGAQSRQGQLPGENDSARDRVGTEGWCRERGWGLVG